MAYSAPRYWAVGEQVTAALLNTHVRDNLNHLGTSHNHGGSAGNGATALGPVTRVSMLGLIGGTAPGSGTLQATDVTGTTTPGFHLAFGKTGAVRVLSQADAGAGMLSLRTLGTGTLQAASGTHTSTAI